ncbi:hypothetical protein QCD60_07530 [Pokkaliibacter sp. MBI-7]|uniref:hypothetical protein n=1 Tax=Pokkaliibacter sp. MBI-7 TaxID=3040600 RepID=UPI00244B4755|nr:hypothetical protein [Pokkaliibacter sp. MBI-7]MDH2432412.1 hypothetical protein [Pokkaliibacter sp. MBI-7]
MTTAINHLNPIATSPVAGASQSSGVALQTGKPARFEHFHPRSHQVFAGDTAAAGSPANAPEQA